MNTVCRTLLVALFLGVFCSSGGVARELKEAYASVSGGGSASASSTSSTSMLLSGRLVTLDHDEEQQTEDTPRRLIVVSRSSSGLGDTTRLSATSMASKESYSGAAQVSTEGSGKATTTASTTAGLVSTVYDSDEEESASAPVAEETPSPASTIALEDSTDMLDISMGATKKTTVTSTQEGEGSSYARTSAASSAAVRTGTHMVRPEVDTPYRVATVPLSSTDSAATSTVSLDGTSAPKACVSSDSSSLNTLLADGYEVTVVEKVSAGFRVTLMVQNGKLASKTSYTVTKLPKDVEELCGSEVKTAAVAAAAVKAAEPQNESGGIARLCASVSPKSSIRVICERAGYDVPRLQG